MFYKNFLIYYIKLKINFLLCYFCIKIFININNKITIKTKDIIERGYATFLKFIIDNYYTTPFPINILIHLNWSINKINLIFKSKRAIYTIVTPDKAITIRSMKSLINQNN